MRNKNHIVRATLVGLVLVACMAATSVAMAYDETGTSADPSNCAACHGADAVSVEATGVLRQGPHGGYTSTGSTCSNCHSVHSASPVGILLLPRATFTETCELCHDGTGGSGVYGAIAARGLTVVSAHRTDTTSTVPGGSESTGGNSTATFSGEGSTLTCGDCHSAHGSNLVQPFTTDRRRNATDTAGFYSSELLRQKPNGATTSTTVYGSQWCGSCHAGRLSGLHDVINHPADTTGTGTFDYEDVQVLTGAGASSTTTGTLGGSNFGYVMPYPRTPGESGHSPICQQCHADGRHVGDVSTGTVAPSEVFSVSSADGGNSSDSPRFQVFPHESANDGLLIETGDDLCSNCHVSSQLR